MQGLTGEQGRLALRLAVVQLVIVSMLLALYSASRASPGLTLVVVVAQRIQIRDSPIWKQGGQTLVFVCTLLSNSAVIVCSTQGSRVG